MSFEQRLYDVIIENEDITHYISCGEFPKPTIMTKEDDMERLIFFRKAHKKYLSTLILLVIYF